MYIYQVNPPSHECAHLVHRQLWLLASDSRPEEYVYLSMYIYIYICTSHIDNFGC